MKGCVFMENSQEMMYDLMSLTKLSNFFEACVSTIKKHENFNEIDKDTVAWYQKNKFDIELMASLLKNLAKENYINFANQLQGKKSSEGLLVLKKLVMPRLISATAKICYMVYKHPNSPFCVLLLEEHPDLIQNGIVRYRVTKEGLRVVVVNDHEKYTHVLLRLQNRYENMIKEELSKREGVANAN